MESELQALSVAMMSCWSRGYTQIIFEGDNQNVSKLVHRETMNMEVINWLKDTWRWGEKFEDI